MIKNNELKRNLTMTVLLILMVIFMASAVLAVPAVKADSDLLNGAVTYVTKETNKALALNSDAIDPNRDHFIVGEKHTPEINPSFSELPWNGKIQAELHLGKTNFIFLNVDPRNVAFDDDVIVEYRSYYVSGNSQISQKILKFSVVAKFYKKSVLIKERVFDKSNDSQAGFTYGSGSGAIDAVRVEIKIEQVNGPSRTATFYFGEFFKNVI